VLKSKSGVSGGWLFRK